MKPITLKAHISLNVKNIEASTGFYSKLFGIKPSKIRKDYAKFDVINPPLNLTLNKNLSQNSTGISRLSHLGIQVTSSEDVLTIREELIKFGVKVRDQMQVDCCYAIQDKFWIQDPDGNEWEVFVVLEDNLPETPERSCCVTESIRISNSE